jgi:hypothetical protein
MTDSAAVAPRSARGAASENLDVEALLAAFRGRTAKIGIIGLGYVGLPLLRACVRRGLAGARVAPAAWAPPSPAVREGGSSA